MNWGVLLVGLVGWAMTYFWKKFNWKVQLGFFLAIITYAIWLSRSKTPSEILRQTHKLSQGLPLPNTIKTALQLTQNVLDPETSTRSHKATSTPAHPPTKESRRSVTALQKRYVASQQQWKCQHCHQLLDESYEVDHIKPLFRGGSNETGNLQALCRNCHGKKTVQDWIR